MDPVVRKLLDEPYPHLKTYEEIGALLPADDAELDGWFVELVEAVDGQGFMTLGVAAIAANRKVDGRHLKRGFALVSNVYLLACFAWHMTGDVPEYLMEGMKGDQILPGYAAFACFAAAAICKERREGVYPPELITQARLIARHKAKQQIVIGAQFAIAEIIRDPALTTILDIKTELQWKQAAKVAEGYRALCFGSPLQLVATEPHRKMGEGGTVRRAVARVGRNELCPCQSGRKYKNCCLAKDAEKLLDSSHIAGKSRAELRAEPEPYLTKKSIEAAPPHEVIRYDPRKIPRERLDDYFFVLCMHSLYERAVEAFEILGFTEDLDDIVCSCFIFLAMRARRIDAIKKLLAIHPRAEQLKKDMDFGACVAIAEEESPALAAVLEEGSLEILKSEEDDLHYIYSCYWLFSKLPATGILVARGLIQSAGDSKAQRILDEIGATRDRLGLSPDDPAEDWVEKRLLEATRSSEAEDSEESRALADTRDRLNTKAREVDFLRKALENARRDVKTRETERAADSAPDAGAAVVTPIDGRALEELRFKVQKLKGELKERHEERVALRQELRETHSKLEAQDRPKASIVVDPEAEYYLPSQLDETQPVRLPEFPKKFDETLHSLPRHVARNAVAMAGRLASGELAAFVGVVRLKGIPEVYRQRIGADHRLLFRVTADRLVVIDLINRRDLVRRIKSLLGG